MIFIQFFEPVTCSFSYLVARRRGGEALLVDPLRDQIDLYMSHLARLDLRLVKAVDTHLHADHVTGLGGLRRLTGCAAAMGAPSRCELLDLKLEDGEVIDVDGLKLRALHTPGHTADSFCFAAEDFVLTGDTLLIHGTGRTDFQDGDAGAQYDSLHRKLLALPEETLVYPGHDYKGRRISSIAEEKALNPRLNVASREAYIELMAGLDLPPPRQMAMAVPANLTLGLPAGEGRHPR